jgi:hypothetical protein
MAEIPARLNAAPEGRYVVTKVASVRGEWLATSLAGAICREDTQWGRFVEGTSWA